MSREDPEFLFCYSEQQLLRENAIWNPMGKKFLVGEVFTGAEMKQFTKRISENGFMAMLKEFPDTKVVAKARASQNIQYVNPTKVTIPSFRPK